MSGTLNLMFDGENRPQIYKGPAVINSVNGGRIMDNLPDGGYASLGTGAGAGNGSIITLTGMAFAFTGEGALYINGVSRSVAASTTPQMLLYVSGSYSGAGTGPFVMGIERASAPTIAETPTADANMSGTISAGIWFVRSATGGRGRASTPSNVLVVNGKTVRLTVDASDLTVASTLGYDRIGIAVTIFGFGLAGPYYFLLEMDIADLTTVDGVADSVELQFTSASLAQAELAPSLDFMPPEFPFMTALEDVAVGVGAYGDTAAGVSPSSAGTAVVTSLPIYIESYPPDNISFLPERPRGVVSRAEEGFSLIPGENSLSALLYTGGKNPTTLRGIWPQVGFRRRQNMTLAEGGRLYGFSSGRDLVRLGNEGEPETAWAAPVASRVRGWDPDSEITGWDGRHKLVVFGHLKELLAFAPAMNQGRGGWCSPFDLTGKITGDLCACVTVRGQLLLAANDGTTVRLYNFNAGTGSVCEVYFPEVMTTEQSMTVMQIVAALRADSTGFPVRLKLFKNGDTSAAAYDSGDITLTRTGFQNLFVRPSLRCARTVQAYLKMTSAGGSDVGPDFLGLGGEQDEVALGVTI